MPAVSDKVVIVTGASRGLGRALSAALIAEGAIVAACSRRGIGSAADATRPSRYIARAVDVASEAQVAAFVDEVAAAFGGIDALVNNASVLGRRVPLAETPVEEWRAVLDVNLTGAFLMTRAVLPHLRARAGSIINVTSGVGDEPRAGWSAYAVSKWALEGFSYNLALEERGAGVRVNLVDPGPMRTDMRRAAYPGEDPSRPAPPARVTPVFLWLISDASRGVTGQRLDAQGWRPPPEGA